MIATIEEEVCTFCPVQLMAGGYCFQGVWDTLQSVGGGFFFLANNNGFDTQLPELKIRQIVDIGIYLGRGNLEIPCKVQELFYDTDGAYVYAQLRFLALDDKRRQEIKHWLGLLW